MSLIWLFLKASRIVETPYDFAIGFILLDLDGVVTAEWLRIWLHLRGR